MIPTACNGCVQVAKPDFFLKTTPMFDAGDNVGMVLTPQYNSNLSWTNDIFNHSNLHFWWYMQPGALYKRETYVQRSLFLNRSGSTIAGVCWQDTL